MSFQTDAVGPVTLTSTDLVDGQLGYLICRAPGGNPKPSLKIYCNGIEQTTLQISYNIDTVSTLMFTPTMDQNGQQCTCIVNQPKTNFTEINQPITLRVSSQY